MLIKLSPLKSLVLLVLVDVLAILLSSLGGEPLAAVAMILTSLAGFQSSRGAAQRGAAWRTDGLIKLLLILLKSSTAQLLLS